MISHYQIDGGILFWVVEKMRCILMHFDALVMKAKSFSA